MKYKLLRKKDVNFYVSEIVLKALTEKVRGQKKSPGIYVVSTKSDICYYRGDMTLDIKKKKAPVELLAQIKFDFDNGNVTISSDITGKTQSNYFRLSSVLKNMKVVKAKGWSWVLLSYSEISTKGVDQILSRALRFVEDGLAYFQISALVDSFNCNLENSSNKIQASFELPSLFLAPKQNLNIKCTIQKSCAVNDKAFPYPPEYLESAYLNPEYQVYFNTQTNHYCIDEFSPLYLPPKKSSPLSGKAGRVATKNLLEKLEIAVGRLGDWDFKCLNAVMLDNAQSFKMGSISYLFKKDDKVALYSDRVEYTDPFTLTVISMPRPSEDQVVIKSKYVRK